MQCLKRLIRNSAAETPVSQPSSSANVVCFQLKAATNLSLTTSSSTTSACNERMCDSGSHLARPLRQRTERDVAPGALGVTLIMAMFRKRIILLRRTPESSALQRLDGVMAEVDNLRRLCGHLLVRRRNQTRASPQDASSPVQLLR